jgi:hypothetical protein
MSSSLNKYTITAIGVLGFMIVIIYLNLSLAARLAVKIRIVVYEVFSISMPSGGHKYRRYRTYKPNWHFHSIIKLV